MNFGACKCLYKLRRTLESCLHFATIAKALIFTQLEVKSSVLAKASS